MDAGRGEETAFQPNKETQKGQNRDDANEKPLTAKAPYKFRPTLLAKVDEIASKMGQSRAALINRAIYELAERVVS